MTKDHEDRLDGETSSLGQAQPKSDILGTCSLGDRATFTGDNWSPPEQSLGDQMTLGFTDGGGHVVDDGIEVVNLSVRYKVEKTLGRGGMGEVLLATDTRLERKVAIKRILNEAARSHTAINRFLTEARSIAALNHANIVQIFDYGQATDGPFLIMEFVDGESLLDRTRTGPLPLEEAVELTCQLCDGLAKAHRAGIIHRDIKPANVLLTKDGIPKLTDFGLAKVEAVETGITMAGAILGTLDFMPPEQRRDATLVDARSDLWSLAATLYQMVTGESPKVIRIKKVPKQLQQLLDKGLEEAKENRFQSAIEFREALSDAVRTIDPSEKQIAAELISGECPACHSGNEAHRKFCRECGESLRCRCPKCKHEIPVWDKVCPECGGKQVELVSEQIAELGRKRAQAELLRAELDYGAAINLANEVSQVDDLRVSVHRDWAVEFEKATSQEQARQLDAAQVKFDESKRHRAAFDYTAAIQAIEMIPQPLRSKEVGAYVARLESERTESAKLLNSIKIRIQNRELEGLLPLVHRALVLQGDRSDLSKLATQLTEREQKRLGRQNDAFQRAGTLLAEGNAVDAMKVVKPIDPARLTPVQGTFLANLERIISAEDELKALVQLAREDGIVSAAEIVELLPRVIEYTQLNPNNRFVQRLRDDLLARTSSVPVELLRTLPEECLVQLPSQLWNSLSNFTNSIGLQFKLIPSGTFRMGEGLFKLLIPSRPHQVTLTRSYFIGVYPITQEQYKRVMTFNPSEFGEARCPVVSVSWDDALKFCRKLSSIPEEKAAGRVYRLPTEAEWEYACRAGCTGAYCFGDDESHLCEYAWYDANSGLKMHPVGEKKPNAWGLFDMHGNVHEWCVDYLNPYPKLPVTDPLITKDTNYRVSRGGSCLNEADGCSSARRFLGKQWKGNPYMGFRVALSLPGKARSQTSMRLACIFG